MIGGFAKGLLFLSSFLPAFLIFTLLNWAKYGPWALLPLLAGFVGILGLLAVLAWVRTTVPIPLLVKSVHRKDAEALAYLVTYVLPFLSVNFSDLTSLAGFFVLFVTLAIIYISADMLHVNPTLSLLGWHVYEVETSAGYSHTVITRRRRLLPADTLSVIPITDEIDWEESTRARKQSYSN